MGVTLCQIQDEVSALKLDDSLLFLNHLLGVSRGYTTDPDLGPVLSQKPSPVFPHIVHLLAKQLLLHASNLGSHTMTWEQFQRLSQLVIELDDPIQHDPNWKHADSTGFFERLLSHQITPQNRRMIQKYGLALGLFRDAGVVEWPQRYDLKGNIESEIGLPLEQFMAMGHVAFALRTASHQGNKCIGTFTPMIFAEAFRLGVDFCVPEVWTPFLDRTSCDRERFREVAQQDIYKIRGSLFEQFGFNPLCRYPIVELGGSRHLAVDPELIVERVTRGLFYDLFERDGTTFSEQFGHVFEQFVGQLLASVCSSDRLWSAAEWERTRDKQNRQSLKIGDWAYRGDDATVLFECKSLRPSLDLITHGSDKSVGLLVERVASAVEQLIGHTQSINNGVYEDAGLRNGPTVGVVVTYGKFHTISGPFVRERVGETLREKGLDPMPFVVLSIDELDMVIRLVESGHSLDKLMKGISEEAYSLFPLYRYRCELSKHAVSSFTMSKGEAFMYRYCSAQLGGRRTNTE